ncbi:Transcription initiation factor IIA subunit 2 [Thelohanellus kitauei]|nr:Transcription initiation factor IIA subunit 2 [Thelohanellus kitauei]
MEPSKPTEGAEQKASMTQVYRVTTPGTTLQESLKEMIDSQQISPFLATDIMSIFDKTIVNVIENKCRNKIQIKGRIIDYRNCESLWTLMVKDANFKDFTSTKTVAYAKIIAFDGKNSSNK